MSWTMTAHAEVKIGRRWHHWSACRPARDRRAWSWIGGLYDYPHVHRVRPLPDGVTVPTRMSLAQFGSSAIGLTVLTQADLCRLRDDLMPFGEDGESRDHGWLCDWLGGWPLFRPTQFLPVYAGDRVIRAFRMIVWFDG